MTDKEFDDLINDKDISNAKAQLAIEAKACRDLSDTAFAIIKAITTAATDLDATAGHLEEMTHLVNSNNSTKALSIANSMQSSRSGIEDALRFKSSDCDDYLHSLTHVTSWIHSTSDVWSEFVKSAYDDLRGEPATTANTTMEQIIAGKKEKEMKDLFLPELLTNPKYWEYNKGGETIYRCHTFYRSAYATCDSCGNCDGRRCSNDEDEVFGPYPDKVQLPDRLVLNLKLMTEHELKTIPVFRDWCYNHPDRDLEGLITNICEDKSDYQLGDYHVIIVRQMEYHMIDVYHRDEFLDDKERQFYTDLFTLYRTLNDVQN